VFSGVSCRADVSRLPDSSILERRLARVRATLRDGMTALVVSHPPNVRYLTNHTGTAGMVVVTRDRLDLLVDPRYQEAVRTRQDTDDACPGLRLFPVPGTYDQALAVCVEELGAVVVGFEARHVSVATYETWRRSAAAARVTWRATERAVEVGRAVKDDFELDCLRRSAAGLSMVAEAAFRAVRPGVSEVEVAAVIEAALRAGGYERPAFDTIVASGPHAALPHHRAGERRMVAGDLVVLDFGGVLDGYCSDITRTVCVGRPTEEMRRVHGAVLSAQRAAIAALQPGAEAAGIDRAARQVLETAGLGDAFVHGTGHGLGLEVHEEPRLPRVTAADQPSALLSEGVVVTVEPGAYIPAWGGVRIEDDVAVTRGGCEVLTSVPHELRACGQEP
jgi:Xaa-Pro aminopeptidase